MFDTPDQISKNKYINNLVAEVEKFGLCGYYINYTLAENPINNGIYFICGYDANQCTDKNNKLDLMYHEQQTTHTARLDYYVIRITDNSPFAVHQAVLSYALHASTMKGILNKCTFPYKLTNVSAQFIPLAESLYSNSINENLPHEEREKNAFALRSFVRKEGKEEYDKNGIIEDDEKIHMASEKITKDSPKNMVSMDRLCFKARQINKIIIDGKNVEQFENELRKRPDILYWKSKTVTAKLDVPDNQGFGSKEANTFSGTTFMYDSKFAKDIQTMQLKITFPEILKYSVTDIKNLGQGLCSIGLGYYSIYPVMKKALERGIPIAIDFKKLWFNCSMNGTKDHTRDDGLITVTISKKDTAEIDKILQEEAKELSNSRILNQEDFKKHALRLYECNAWDIKNPDEAYYGVDYYHRNDDDAR